MTNQRRLVAAKKIKIIHLLVVAAALFAVSWAPYFTLLVIAVSTNVKMRSPPELGGAVCRVVGAVLHTSSHCG